MCPIDKYAIKDFRSSKKKKKKKKDYYLILYFYTKYFIQILDLMKNSREKRFRNIQNFPYCEGANSIFQNCCD